jgi:hypothetical protein
MHREAQQFSQLGSVSTTLDLGSGVHARAGLSCINFLTSAATIGLTAGLIQVTMAYWKPDRPLGICRQPGYSLEAYGPCLHITEWVPEGG